MEKPTVFFSHSSKDKDALIAFRNRFCEITCDVINVFMSSDGQSIPFGSNWVHKIDEGLKVAKIMFIFVTPNSILSNWIYFEAGYAYSKGIKVIPVGFDVDITILKPPLNLLQGFNANSSESLNNFIAIVNKEFSTNFGESFCDKDYSTIISNFDLGKYIEVTDIFSEINISIYSQIYFGDGEEDIDQLFGNFYAYLNKLQIPFTDEKFLSVKFMLVGGIGLSLYPGEKIIARLSPYNLDVSFKLFSGWLSEYCSCEYNTLHFTPHKSVRLLSDQETVSSIIYNHLNIFSIIPNQSRKYKYKTIIFSISNIGGEQYALSIKCDIKNTTIEEIYELINFLQEIKIINII